MASAGKNGSMMLRLYRVPYFDPIDSDLVRLLFEGMVTGESADRARIPFYMYVWINSARQVTGFQAVFDEEMTATYKAPSVLTFGRIGQNPVNRTIEECEESETRESLARAVAGMSNREFSDLVDWSARLVSGETSPNCYTLNHRESRELSTLTSERP